jgi:hypothetical protein
LIHEAKLGGGSLLLLGLGLVIYWCAKVKQRKAERSLDQRMA